MSHRLQSIAILGLGLLAGCSAGAPDTSNPGTPPPHAGTLHRLPEDLGFVEVVKGNGSGPEVSFFFLDPSKAPLAAPPTSGTLTTGKKVVPLTAEGGALVAPPGTALFKGGEPDGELKTEIGGKPVAIGLDIR